jgi:hypothetical protein
MRHATGVPTPFFSPGNENLFFFRRFSVNAAEEEVFFRMLSKISVWDRECGRGESGKKAKMTLDAGGKSVSEKSQATPDLQEPLLEIKK